MWIIGVPTAQPQFGPFFMDHTGLHAAISNDLVPLRKTFHFANAPYAVAIEKGRQREACPTSTRSTSPNIFALLVLFAKLMEVL